MEIAPLLFDLGTSKPTSRQIADRVKAGGADARGSIGPGEDALPGDLSALQSGRMSARKEPSARSRASKLSGSMSASR